MNKVYCLYLFERKAVCPICSGMIITTGEDYRCVDCHGIFKVVGIGLTDKEIMCEHIEKVG